DTLHTQHATVSYAQPGPYSITLIASKGNCTAQRTFTDTILAHQAVAGFTAVQGNDCLPVQASFTDQSAGAVAWAWDFGDSTQQNGQHPQHTYAVPPTGPVVLSIIDSNGCTDTAMANPLQFFTPSVQLSTQSGCVPLAVQISDATGSAVSCIWDFGDGNTAQTLAASHTYGQAGTYQVSLLAQSALGCWDTVMASNPVVVEGSQAAFDTVGHPGFCAPLPIQFQNQSVNAQSWAWDFGDGAQSTLEHPAHVYVQAGQYTVSLIATSPLGCTDTVVQPAFIKASGPMADLAVSDTNACQPVDIQFTDLSAQAVSWEWYFGDGAVSYQQHPVHTYKDPGTYSVSLLARDSLGCTEYQSFEFIKVHATPEAAFSISSTTACLGTPVVYTNGSQHLDSASHAWSLGSGITSSARDTTIMYTQPGPFYPVLIVTNPSGCADTATANHMLTVYDTAAAQQQGLHYATVESDSTIEVHWPANTQSNFARYRLFRQNLWRTFDQLDSIANPTVTYVSDHNRPNDYQPSCYRIMTEAHCAAPPHPDSLTTYCTMHLDAFAQTRANLLRWTPYVGCAVAGYAIQRQFSAGDPFQTIATVPAGTLTYSDSAELCPATYRYRIVATGLCGTQHTSASNERTLTPLKSVIAAQQTPVIRTTVEHNQAILTEWKAPEISPESVRYYDLLRAEGDGPFERLVRLPAGAHSYLDEQVYPQNYAYTYKIRVVNHCDIPTQAGTIGKSILLKASTRDYAATLNWSRYEAWESGVETYVIERQDAFGNWQPVKRVNGNTHRTVILLTEGE
ncbi:MAG: PKD domain-containing protein, partial [Bacteroidota bacterium]